MARNHEAIIAEPKLEDYEDFLLQQLAAKPFIGYKAMCIDIRNAKGVKFEEAPIRTWLTAHKGALPMPGAEAASSSSAPSMALLQLSDLEQKQYGDFLRQQLSETPSIGVVELRDRLSQEHDVSCKERAMQHWLERARATVPIRALKRGRAICRR